MTQISDSTAKWRISFILLASTLTVMAGATMAPALPDMHKAFAHLPHAELLVKSVVGLPGLVVALTAPLISLLFRRIDKSTVLLSATLIYGVTGASGYWFDTSLTAILTGRVALGIAVAGIAVSSMTLIADHYAPEQRARYLGLQAAFTGFGGVAFMFLGGILADVEWTYAFLLYLFALALAPGVWLFVDEPSTRKASHNAPDKPDFQRRAWLPAVYLMAIVEIIALYMVPLHLPFYLSRNESAAIDAGASEVGTYIAIMLLAMAVVAMFFGRIRQLADPFIVQAIGLVLLAVGIGASVMAQTTTAMLIALVVVGGGLGLMRPNLAAFVFSITPPHDRGRVMGKVTTSYFLGQFLAPFATQPLVTDLGYTPAFLTISVLLIVIAACCIAAWLRQPAAGLALGVAPR